jgi:glycosyltransferase 2 family protein
LIDFGFSEVAAQDGQLSGDVAELLTSMSLKVGPARAVRAAVDVLGPAAVASSMPRLQRNALSGATRSGVKGQTGLLTELRDTVSVRTGTVQPPLEHLQRISAGTVGFVVICAAAVHFLLPQLGDVGEMWRQVQEADWEWVPPILAMSALTYVGATLSMTGAVPIRLRILPTLLAQVASSFVNRVTPANVGGMALNARFLQKTGLDSGAAVTGVALNTLGGVVVQLVLTALFLVWAGRTALRSFSLPSPEKLLLGVAVVSVLALVAVLVPAVRRTTLDRLVNLSRSLAGAAQVVRRPDKLALLLGGSALVTTTYILSLYYASLAFGGRLGLPTVGAVYLVGSTIASAAPTPGGIGAVEAALIGGLTAAGMPTEVAVPTVLLYRLATFWLPVLPGWLSLSYPRRADYI